MYQEHSLVLIPAIDAPDSKATMSPEIRPLVSAVDLEKHPKESFIAKIPRFYRLLELVSDVGTNGFGAFMSAFNHIITFAKTKYLLVEKIMVSDLYVRKLCNDWEPKSFEIGEVHFSQLDRHSTDFEGIYGNRTAIAAFLREENLISNDLYHDLTEGDDGNKRVELMPPGLYVLYTSTHHAYVIHWPESNAYSNKSRSLTHQNMINFQSYLMEVTTKQKCVMLEEDVELFDFSEQTDSKASNSKQKLGRRFKVGVRKEEKASFALDLGFQIHVHNAIPAVTSQNKRIVPIVVKSESFQTFVVAQKLEAHRETIVDYHIFSDESQRPFALDDIVFDSKLEFNTVRTLIEILKLEKFKEPMHAYYKNIESASAEFLGADKQLQTELSTICDCMRIFAAHEIKSRIVELFGADILLAFFEKISFVGHGLENYFPASHSTGNNFEDDANSILTLHEEVGIDAEAVPEFDNLKNVCLTVIEIEAKRLRATYEKLITDFVFAERCIAKLKVAEEEIQNSMKFVFDFAQSSPSDDYEVIFDDIANSSSSFFAMFKTFFRIAKDQGLAKAFKGLKFDRNLTTEFDSMSNDIELIEKAQRYTHVQAKFIDIFNKVKKCWILSGDIEMKIPSEADVKKRFDQAFVICQNQIIDSLRKNTLETIKLNAANMHQAESEKKLCRITRLEKYERYYYIHYSYQVEVGELIEYTIVETDGNEPELRNYQAAEENSLISTPTIRSEMIFHLDPEETILDVYQLENRKLLLIVRGKSGVRVFYGRSHEFKRKISDSITLIKPIQRCDLVTFHLATGVLVTLDASSNSISKYTFQEDWETLEKEKYGDYSASLSENGKPIEIAAITFVNSSGDDLGIIEPSGKIRLINLKSTVKHMKSAALTIPQMIRLNQFLESSSNFTLSFCAFPTADVFLYTKGPADFQLDANFESQDIMISANLLINLAGSSALETANFPSWITPDFLKSCQFTTFAGKTHLLGFLKSGVFVSFVVRNIQAQKSKWQLSQDGKVRPMLRGQPNSPIVELENCRVEVGDMICYSTQRRLVLKVDSSGKNVAEIESAFDVISEGPMHIEVHILSREKSNELLDSICDVYRKFPVLSAVQKFTSESPNEDVEILPRKLEICLIERPLKESDSNPTPDNTELEASLVNDSEIFYNQPLSTLHQKFNNYFKSTMLTLTKTGKITNLNDLRLRQSVDVDVYLYKSGRESERRDAILTVTIGKWIIQLLTLIPIQIAAIQNGELAPLRNGVSTDEFPKLATDVQQQEWIKFGWLELILTFFRHLRGDAGEIRV
ncbi:hypothetical protein HK098_004122 [Nowakowskiella sp. JEL0407]|nr:hypothetical protein HK098_004122 [Nowakowskiella sp. JEL0407]